jgi:hypothetical protein
VENVRITAAVATVAVALLGSCSVPGGGETERIELLRPPGTQLGDDLVVPDGTSLIGTRFPGHEDGAWSAVLLIEDDPFDVVRSLVEQSEAAGLDIGANHFQGNACMVFDGTLLECGLVAAGADPERSYSFSLRWGREQGATYRHLLVSRNPSMHGTGPTITAVETDLPPAPESVDAWEPPDVGEPLAEPPKWFDERVVVREEGTTMLAPAGPAWCVTGGYNAVLRVEGEPDEVVAGYAAQFDELGFDGDVTRSTFEGRGIRAARHTTAGGGNLDAIVVTGEGDEPTLLLISRCND